MIRLLEVVIGTRPGVSRGREMEEEVLQVIYAPEVLYQKVPLKGETVEEMMVAVAEGGWEPIGVIPAGNYPGPGANRIYSFKWEDGQKPVAFG